MKKIKTLFGYLCVPDERMAENATALYNDMYQERNFPVITVMSNDAKKQYRIANPYGVGYTNHYSRVLDSQNEIMKLTSGNPSREIDFLEIS